MFYQKVSVREGKGGGPGEKFEEGSLVEPEQGDTSIFCPH